MNRNNRYCALGTHWETRGMIDVLSVCLELFGVKRKESGEEQLSATLKLIK